VWSGGFWTATSSEEDPTDAWVVRFFDGLVGTNIKTYPNSHVWCVRGGDAPVITSDGAGPTAAVNAAENQTAVTTVTASDADLPADTLQYTIIGGADAALFSLDINTGVLAFNRAPDFEAPGDVGANNVYDVTVQVSDGQGGLDTQAIAVTVTDVNGEATTLDGTFKGRNWCAPIIGTTLNTAEATKTKIKDPVNIVWEFDDFPDIDAVVTNGPLVFAMDGTAVRKNDKKGFFIMQGVEVTAPGGNFQQLVMQGSYKNDASQLPLKNVPTSIKGKWWLQAVETGNFATTDPAALVCATETGTFKASGSGVTF
jgi:hypothetical protein